MSAKHAVIILGVKKGNKRKKNNIHQRLRITFLNLVCFQFYLSYNTTTVPTGNFLLCHYAASKGSKLKLSAISRYVSHLVLLRDIRCLTINGCIDPFMIPCLVQSCSAMFCTISSNQAKRVIPVIRDLM